MGYIWKKRRRTKFRDFEISMSKLSYSLAVGWRSSFFRHTIPNWAEYIDHLDWYNQNLISQAFWNRKRSYKKGKLQKKRRNWPIKVWAGPSFKNEPRKGLKPKTALKKRSKRSFVRSWYHMFVFRSLSSDWYGSLCIHCASCHRFLMYSQCAHSWTVVSILLSLPHIHIRLF